MKKKAKKLLAILLSSITLFACTFTATSCSKPLTFENFDSKSVEVSLGESYRLELSPMQGSDGKYYSVVATVKDETGKEVPIDGSIVLIDSLKGYTVTYSIVDGSKVVKSITVILTVKNSSKPNILLEDVKSAYGVGETFVLPKAKVYDVSGENLKAEIKILDSEGKEVPFDKEKGEFLCEKEGEYLLRATAKNSGGIEGETTFSFEVAALKQLLFSASEKSVKNISNGDTLNNKVLDKAAIDALNLKGFYPSETALMLDYRNQVAYTLKGLNPWYADEYYKHKYFTMNFAFVKEESANIAEEGSICFHGGNFTSGEMSYLLYGADNGFGSNVNFIPNTKYDFNTWYQITLPAEKLEGYLNDKGEIKLFGLFEYKVGSIKRNGLKVVIGDIEVYNEKIYDTNGDNYTTEDYFS